jgi:hypothetical protein
MALKEICLHNSEWCSNRHFYIKKTPTSCHRCEKVFLNKANFASRLPHGAAAEKNSIMLSSISWQQFLAAILIITVVYYGYVIPRYYQKEVAVFFNLKKNAHNLTRSLQNTPFEVMGKAKPDFGVSVTEPEDLQFAGPSEDGTEVGLSENAAISDGAARDPSAELKADIGKLIDAFKDVDDKREFLMLLRIQFNTYKGFKDQINLPDIQEYILRLSNEKLSFSIDRADLAVKSA